MRRLGRHPERGRSDRALLDDLLRVVPTGVLSSVTHDGLPWAVPILHALDGDRLLFHGSTGAGLLRHLAAGAPVVYTVFVQDSWVLGPSTFSSSADYRSATISGTVDRLTGPDKEAALAAFAEVVFPGRAAEVRPSTAKELAATGICALPIRDGEWLYKTRSHGAAEPEEPTEAWCGTVPVTRTLGTPQRATWCSADQPPSVSALVARGV